jgi:hypothetical protein
VCTSTRAANVKFPNFNLHIHIIGATSRSIVYLMFMYNTYTLMSTIFNFGA